MNVRCPHCSTEYFLPDQLLGEGGARVRCPTCGGDFLVVRSASTAVAPGPSPLAEPAPGVASALAAGEAEGSLPPAVVAALSLPGHLPGSADRAAVAPAADPAAIATEVFQVLETILGEALARSRARGTVLSDHGPAILAVWDEYRRRAGPDAPSAAFRAALRDRCGVDLTRLPPSGRDGPGATPVR